jgi:hypothetical protein
MNYLLRIFGQEKKALAPGEVKQFIHDGFFFKHEPVFEIHTTDEFTWSIKIIYDSALEPVFISCSLSDPDSKNALEEINFILDASKASAPKERILKLIGTVVIFYTIEINQKELTKDAWEMLDMVEAMLMRSCNGILFTADNEFYDEKLKKFYKL